MTAWNLLVLGVGALAAAADLRWRSIPAGLTASAFIVGLIHAALTGTLASALGAVVMGLALGLVLLHLDAFGGGDAKLLVALGALVGVGIWLWTISLAMMAAAAAALVQLARRGRLPFLGADLMAIVGGWRQYGFSPHPSHRLQSPDTVAAPFAVALFVGLVAALWLR